MLDVNKLVEAQMLVRILTENKQLIDENTEKLSTIKKVTTEKKIKRLFTIFWLIAWGVFVIVILYLWAFQRDFIYYMIGDLKEGETLFDALSAYCVAFGSIYAIAAAFILLVLRKLLERRERARQYTPEEIEMHDRYCDEISRSQSLVQDASIQLETSEIPKAYLNVFALSWMVEAATNKRADTLKELINLYERYLEDERRHQEQILATSKGRYGR